MAKRTVAAVLVLFAIGCGRSAVNSTSLANTYKGLGEADQAHSAKDYSKARTLYTAALDGGTLQGDLTAEAYMKRGLCHAKAGDLDKAAADLDKAEEGAAAGPYLHLARGELYLKRGDKSKA